MICSKMLDVVYVVDKAYVRNIDDTGTRDSPHYVNGDKKKAFMKLLKRRYGECCARGCRARATETAHVWVRIDGEDKAFLTPLCFSCNRPSNNGYFLLKKRSPIIPLIKIKSYVQKTNPVFNPLVDAAA